MSLDGLPRPEPRGALVPPVRRPPTALGTDASEPPPPPGRSRSVRVTQRWSIGPAVMHLMNAVLDAVDQVGDDIAVELGIRPSLTRSSPGDPPASR